MKNTAPRLRSGRIGISRSPIKFSTRSSLPAHQVGLSLVELLVSLVIGLILIGGVLNIVISSRESFRVNENLIRMQENARTGFDILARSIREAGENSCGTNLVANVIRSSNAIPWWSNWGAGTIQGIDGATASAIVAFGTGLNDRVTGTDAIVVLQAEQDESLISVDQTALSQDLTLQSATGLAVNDVVFACDTGGGAIFQIGTLAGTPKVLNYEKSFTALNCNNNLIMGDETADCSATISAATPAHPDFKIGGSIAKLSSTFWYIGNNSSGQRSLYRSRMTKSGTNITTVKEEMLTGVQDLQATYLTKTVSTGALATDWVAANDAVYTGVANGWSRSNPSQTVAVRIALTLQSDEKISVSQQPIQRQLISVISLRSRETLF